MAKLYFRYGSMNCGKTTSLLQVSHNYSERNMGVVILKPKIDTKGEDKIISRLGISRKVDFSISDKDNIYEMIKELVKINTYDSIDVVLVDEAQFLKKEQIDQLLYIAVVLDIPVICYGLRTDFQMNGFEGSERLLLLAHSIEELKTICKCGKKATVNGRKINGKFVFKGEQVSIDNQDKIEYVSLCPSCYLQLKGECEK